MTTQPIKTATQTEVDQCIAMFVLAFSSDPVARWMYSDPYQYLENLPHFLRAFGGRAFEHGSAHYIDRFLASALWLPPDVRPDKEVLVALIENSVPASQRKAVFAVFEQMAGYHPNEPHWYLSIIGTDPTQQGRGYGSALLRHALAFCDQKQTPAYLEASSERSVLLYQRHGFLVLGTIQVGTSPPIFPMLRKQR